MKEQNLIVFFVDGSSKIFRGPMKIDNCCPSSHAIFTNGDGVWSLNMEQIKYLCMCDNEQLSRYLGSLDRSYVNFDTCLEPDD